MNLGYARVFEEEQGSGAMRQRMLEAVQDDRFLFEDIRNKEADTELKQARKEAVKKQDDVDSTEAQIASYLDKLEEAMKDEPK